MPQTFLAFLLTN